MAEEGRWRYDDLESLRVVVRQALSAGDVRYHMRHIRQAAHTEMTELKIDGILYYGRYQVDKDHRATKDRFVSMAQLPDGQNGKAVFEIWPGENDTPIVVVLTAYLME